MASYVPKPLGELADGRLSSLVQAARQRRLVLYLGAGISMAEPSCGPRGSAVADALRPMAERWLGVADGTLSGLTLEMLSQRVAQDAPDRLEDLRNLAANAFGFRTITPNYGHAAAALLLRGGLVQIISVNWDCGIERAGEQIGTSIQGVVNTGESVAITYQRPLYKVHGCSTRPTSLALTQDEVDSPQVWAIGRTQGALTNGVVAFVGLGTIGVYVKEPFPALVGTWAKDATIMVVDPTLQHTWQDALNGRADDVHFARNADEFLDELLRAVVNNALDSVEQSARSLAENDGWAQLMVAGLISLRDALHASPADLTMRWWSDGFESDPGAPFITELAGEKCLLTAALLSGQDGGGIAVQGSGGRQTVATETRYLEIASRPREHISQVQTAVRHRIEKRRADGVYDDARPVTVIVVDAMGESPSPAAPVDIASGNLDSADILDGPEGGSVVFVTAEDGVSGRLVA